MGRQVIVESCKNDSVAASNIAAANADAKPFLFMAFAVLLYTRLNYRNRIGSGRRFPGGEVTAYFYADSFSPGLYWLVNDSIFRLLND